jgi:hypothetical protein
VSPACRAILKTGMMDLHVKLHSIDEVEQQDPVVIKLSLKGYSLKIFGISADKIPRQAANQGISEFCSYPITCNKDDWTGIQGSISARSYMPNKEKEYSHTN